MQDIHRKLDLILVWLAHQDRRLARMETILVSGDNIIMSALDDLKAQVQATTDVAASAVTLIHGLADQLAASKDDPAKIAALAATLKSSSDALAAAVVANTPAAPPAPPAPPADPPPAAA